MYGKYGGGVESLVGGWEGGACSDAILAKNQRLDRTPCAASTSTCRRNADISDMHICSINVLTIPAQHRYYCPALL